MASIKQELSSFTRSQVAELERLMNATQADLAAVKVELADVRAKYNAHCHLSSGATARTSAPDATTAIGVPGSASAIAAPADLTLTE